MSSTVRAMWTEPTSQGRGWNTARSEGRWYWSGSTRWWRPGRSTVRAVGVGRALVSAACQGQPVPRHLGLSARRAAVG
ncbi:hypothetical protein ACFXDF_39125, partial [Streptomyces sp. NPDC059426]|uniref:hypothetical protein n=1 Tax=Streptomyces sp. NPDC059426 TaxID=3346827 RepID=UPI00367E9E7A